MFKNFSSISLVLFWLVFLQFAGECFALPPDYAREGLSNSERVYLLYSHVTSKWPADEIWPQMREAMTNVADGNDAGAGAAIDKVRTEFSQNQYLPVALHEIAKLYRLVGEKDKSLPLHQYVVDTWPSHEYTMWSLRELAILENARGNVETAQAITERVLTDFANNKYIAFVGYEIAIRYQLFKNYQEAKQLYQYVIDHWPEQTDYVRWCQAGLDEVNIALAEQAASMSEVNAKVESAKSSIANDDMEAAEAVINELLTSYPQDPHIAEPLFEIAECCQQFKKYEKAKQLYQYIVDTWPQHHPARWSQSGVAMCHIGLGNMQAAETATQKLLADFPQTLPMANCVYDVAHQYYKFGNYEKAKQLYQYALDNWPGSRYAMWTKIGLARSNISLGDNTAAEATTDGLVSQLDADFPDDTDLSTSAAKGYHDAGECYHHLKKHVKSIDCYQKVVDRCPDYKYAWNAQFMIGQNYEKLLESKALSESEANTKIKAAYQQLLKKYPDCPAAKAAQTWLSQ